jgi:hypothetical protein
MNRKELARRYRETPRPAGVYRVVHRPSGRTLLGASRDAPAMLNRIRAQLSLDSHPSKRLQADWDNDGEAAFDFDIVDLLPEPEHPGEDVAGDLETLLQLWEETLQIEPESRY